MYCPHCGREIKNQGKFCPYCGKNMGSDQTSRPFGMENGSTTPPNLIPAISAKSIGSLILGIIVILAAFQKWMNLDLWLTEYRFSLFEMHDISEGIDDLFAYAGSDAQIWSKLITILFFVFMFAAIVVVVLEIVHFALVLLSRPNALSTAHTAAKIGVTMSSAYITLWVLINIYIAMGLEYFSFNDVVKITVWPFIFLILLFIQGVITGKAAISK